MDFLNNQTKCYKYVLGCNKPRVNCTANKLPDYVVHVLIILGTNERAWLVVRLAVSLKLV